MKSILVVAALALALVACPAGSEAQGVAQTFDELRLLVRPGDTLTVTDASGRQVRGRLSDLSSTGLTLTIDRAPRQWTEAQVAAISQRYGDSLGNGALIGLGVGGGLAAVGLAVGANSGDLNTISAGEVLLVMGVYAGLGAAIGVGIDALIPGHRLVFERRASGSASLAVGPIVGRNRVGARLSIGF